MTTNEKDAVFIHTEFYNLNKTDLFHWWQEATLSQDN